MDLNKKKEPKVEYKWTREQEELLAEWAEKATCYRWLHSRSEKLYRIRNYTFTIPVIILSTLTGTANFAMDSFVPEENKQIAMAAVGSVNIFAGILSTLQNFLRYAELMEAHRLSELQWSKFGRNIEVELALEPKRRKSAHDFLKVCRAEYDRLIEQSPTIDDSIINQFKHAFSKIDICKPDTCNGMHKCKIYEPGKEEKAANLMANVTEKLNQKKKEKKENIQYTHKEQSIRELSHLMGMGKVSAFTKKSQSVSPTNSVVDQINEAKTLMDLNEEVKEVKEVKEVDEVEEILPETKPEEKQEEETVTDIETGNNDESETDFLGGIK